MNRVYHPYWKWEDWKNGMYSDFKVDNESELVNDCVNLFCSPINFDNACENVIENWPISTSENLSNCKQNRNAWIGAAACCITHGASEYITRIAWGKLTIEQQNIANRIAKKRIENYEIKNRGLHSELGAKLLF